MRGKVHFATNIREPYSEQYALPYCWPQAGHGAELTRQRARVTCKHCLRILGGK